MDGGANGDEPTTTVVTAMAAVSLPVVPAPSLDRLGFCEWGMGGAVNLSYRTPRPPLLFIMTQCDGGPPASDRLGAHDQGTWGVRVGLCRWAESGPRSKSNMRGTFYARPESARRPESAPSTHPGRRRQWPEESRDGGRRTRATARRRPVSGRDGTVAVELNAASNARAGSATWGVVDHAEIAATQLAAAGQC